MNLPFSDSAQSASSKVDYVKCSSCGYQGQPQVSKWSWLMGSKAKSNVCPNCGKGELRNVFDGSPVVSFVEAKQSRRSSYKAFIVFLIIVVVNVVRSYFGDGVSDEVLINTNKAAEFMSQGQFTEAAQLYNKAASSTRFDEDKTTLYMNAAYAYLDDNSNDDAIRSFELAQKYAGNGTAQYDLIAGEISLLQGNAEEALAHLDSAYTKNPQDYQINNTFGVFYLGLDDVTESYKDPAKALTHLKIAYEADNTVMTVKGNLGFAYSMMGDYDKAIEFFLDAQSMGARGLDVWIGLMYVNKGDLEVARSYLEKAQEKGFISAEDVENYLSDSSNE